jgi:hypothetical protein
MAARQALENEIIELRDDQLTYYLRMIDRIDPASAAAIAEATSRQLKLLKKARDKSKAKRVPFEGALNFDTASLLAWVAKITRGGLRSAVKQLQTIDATAAARAGL